MNGFAGVFRGRDPVGDLRRMGIESAWHDPVLALGGAPVSTDRSGEIVVCGEFDLTNLPALRTCAEWPEADSGAVLAELWCRGGAEEAGRLRGMYAAAVWDRRRGHLTLLRDGAGARTLYYSQTSQCVAFAARTHRLRRAPNVAAELDLASVRAYLTMAYVPGNRTMWRDIREVRPGTAFHFPEGRESVVWQPSEPPWDPEAPLSDHASRLRPRLETAVRVRMPEDGPVCIALSGGLDSSLVTAMAAQAATGRVHTFSINFGTEHRNELEYSDLVARHCGTLHRVLTFPGETIRDALQETLSLLDDPIGDPLTVPNLLLARAAANESPVLLNGEGGDPCFGGPKNAPMLLDTLYSTTEDRAASYLRSYQKCYDDLPALLTPQCQASLRDEEPLEATFEPYLADPTTKDYLDRLMLLNLRFKGSDHILTKVSNLTGACGLSGRSPLFDESVVDAAFAIPSRYKLAGAEEKRVLKAAVADLLPAAILERPKSGMLVPVQSWFRGDFRRFATDQLLGRRARIKPLLNQRLIRTWLEYRGNLWPRHGVKLWLLLTLELWLREAGF